MVWDGLWAFLGILSALLWSSSIDTNWDTRMRRELTSAYGLVSHPVEDASVLVINWSKLCSPRRVINAPGCDFGNWQSTGSSPWCGFGK